MNKALESHRAQESVEAMRDEVMNMLTYRVGHYIHYWDIPLDERDNILQSFMFIKHKEFPDGSYDRTKARMVGNGANQGDHMYDLISSSTVALSSVFLLFNLASYHRATLASYDVKGAFLNAEFGPNDTPTYLKVNAKITKIWLDMDPSATPYVDDRGELLLQLDKFIYGLKQSPRKFQEILVQFLIELGYEQLGNDECLFIKRTANPAVFSIVSTHVDDLLQVATDDRLVRELHLALVARFKHITFSPNAESYIGMTIERSADRSRIRLTQVGLIDKILDKYCPDDHKTSKDPHSDLLFQPDSAADTTPVDKKHFLGLVMSLMYLARLTRGDIHMPVVFLAARSHCCTQADLREAYKVCRYLRGTRDIGVNIHCTSLQIHAICDASYQVHMDAKSHTGFILAMGENQSYLHCRSGKQKLTAQSSTDAEVLAMVEALKMAIWMRNILIEMRIAPREQIIVHQDNKSSIMMVEDDSTKCKRSKHILSKITFAKEQRKLGITTTRYTNTGEISSDLLTKPLHGAPFVKHRKRMLGLPK